MKKAGKKFKHTAATPPTLVALKLRPEAGIAERMALVHLTSGEALEEHYNVLWDCHAMLVFGSSQSKDASVKTVADFSSIALANIRNRWEAGKLVRAEADEIEALRMLVDYSNDFWSRQSGRRYQEAYHHVTRCRELYRQQERKTS